MCSLKFYGDSKWAKGRHTCGSAGKILACGRYDNLAQPFDLTKLANNWRWLLTGNPVELWLHVAQHANVERCQDYYPVACNVQAVAN